MGHAKQPRRRSSGALSLKLPSRLVVDTIRLAELMGTPFQVELAVSLATALERQGADPEATDPRELARSLPTEPEAWEPVRLWLPSWQQEMVRSLAEQFKLPLGKTLAVLLAPVVDDHLQVATYALEHQVTFLKARRVVAEKPTNPLTTAPVPPRGSRRRTTKKRTA